MTMARGRVHAGGKLLPLARKHQCQKLHFVAFWIFGELAICINRLFLVSISASLHVRFMQ